MSNREIEDVLSSIRRLVSDDLRPAVHPSKGESAPLTLTDAVRAPADPAMRTTDKLLLTPAFRVPVADAASADVTTAPESVPKSDDGSDVPVAGAQKSDTYDVHDHYEWLSDPENDDWRSAKGAAATAQPGPASSGTDDVVAAPASAAEASTGIEDVVSRLGAAVNAADDEWESPMGDADLLPTAQEKSGDGATPPAPELTFVSHTRVKSLVVDTAMPEPEIHPELEADATDDDDGGEGHSFSSTATLEQDEIDPIPSSGPSASRRVVTPPDASQDDWADAAEAAVMEDLARDVEHEAADLFVEDEGGMTFDEEVLRDLVRDIIREELAGTLGERITRNVRKLVRAEIARALAVREFE